MIPAELLRKKRDGAELSNSEIRFFIEGIVRGTINEAQAAAFLMAVCTRGLNARETAELTMTMRDSGSQFDFSAMKTQLIDKHSTGGVGDKLSLIIVPLVAACGVCVPMMSGRGLGHTGGTVDKLESILGIRLDFNDQELSTLLQTQNCFMIKATQTVAPADRILYALRDITGTIESTSLITASILCKKLVEDLDGLVIDMKVGRGAFMQTREQANELAESMLKVAAQVGLRMSVVFTNMDNPLGSSIGNWIEMLESEQCLLQYDVCPIDLRELSEVLASEMLMLADVNISSQQALDRVRKVWKDGSAHERFMSLIRAQGGDWEASKAQYAQLQYLSVCATENGVIQSYDTRSMGIAAIELGAGRKRQDDIIDHAAGFQLVKKVGSEVRQGDEILRIQATKGDRLHLVAELLQQCIHIGDVEDPTKKMILELWHS